MAVAEQTGEYQEERTNKGEFSMGMGWVGGRGGGGTTAGLFVRDFSLLYCIAGQNFSEQYKGERTKRRKK